jgi:hypothetical protein
MSIGNMDQNQEENIDWKWNEEQVLNAWGKAFV